MNTHLLRTGIRFWLVDTLIAALNFFVLMNLIYERRWGSLVAHQIGMSARIIAIFVLAYLLLRHVKEYSIKDLIVIALVWLGLGEIFEWGGSFILRRPVEEILVGWNIFAGYMWPYVTSAYLLANLIVGVTLHAASRRPPQKEFDEIGDSLLSDIDWSKFTLWRFQASAMAHRIFLSIAALALTIPAEYEREPVQSQRRPSELAGGASP